MVTRLHDSQFTKDFAYGDVTLTKPATQEDMKQGIDAWVGGIAFAWRKRRIPLQQYRQISIRAARASGVRTEYDKLLDGSCKAKVYIFQFIDSVVICRVEDIVGCLKHGNYQKRNNPDYETSVIYLDIDDIPHLEISTG